MEEVTPESSHIESPIVSSGPSFLQKHKKKLMIGGAAVLVILFFIGLFFWYSQNKKVENAPVESESTVPLAPKFAAETYGEAPEFGELQREYISYTLKSNFTTDEAQSVGEVFGATQMMSDENGVVTLHGTGVADGLLSFDKNSGYFTYLALHDKKIYTTDPLKGAFEVINSIGLNDKTITCEITYKKQNVPGVTYVECHRQWDNLGLPLLAMPGVVNAGLDFDLKKEKVGYVLQNTPNDPNIINVSTGQNGKIRPADFNTVTVGITANNTLHSIESNMRWIESEALTASSTFVTPNEALVTLTKNNSQYSVTLPLGAADFTYEEVYPDGNARSKNASIDTFSLVYLDAGASSSQKNYQPYYLISGLSTLNSGYQVRYTAVVPALKSGSRIAEGDGIQLDTFSPVPNNSSEEPESTPTPTKKQPRPTPTPSEDDCFAEGTISGPAGQVVPVTIPGYGLVTFQREGASSNGRVYYSGPDANGIRDAVFSYLSDKYALNYRAYLGQEASTIATKVLFMKEYGSLSAFYEKHVKGLNYVQKQILTDSGAFPPAPSSIPASRRVKILIASFETDAKDIESKPETWGGERALPPGHGSIDIHLRAMADSSSTCYITPDSPAIFIYSDTDRNVTVAPAKSSTYTDPQVENGKWSVFIPAKSTVVTTKDGKDHSYLYYEFISTKLGAKDYPTGISVKKENLEDTLDNFSNSIGLNLKESQVLVSEIKKALVGQSEKAYVNLELVDENTLGRELPLEINPTPSHLYRIHFVVSTSEVGSSFNKIEYPRIIRDGYTVLEIGASTKK